MPRGCAVGIGERMKDHRIKNAYHEVVYVRTIQYPGRLYPLVLLENGRPGYVINAFINYLLMRGEQESSFQQKLQSVCQLYEYCRRKYAESDLSEEQIRSLIFEFGSAKLHGTIQPDGSDPLNLGWRPIMPKTLRNIVRNLQEFDTFQVAFFNAKQLNPVEVKFQSNFERYMEFKARSKYDPLLHLFPSHSTERTAPVYQAKEHRRDSLKRRPEKVFPGDFIIDLVEKTEEPRDKMLLLLMGFGGLRRSEPLHLFHQDVVGRFKDTGAAWVVLADPIKGQTTWQDARGNACSGTRREFLVSQYRNEQLPVGHPLRNLQPRCLYGRGSNQMHVGFKGMTFSGHDQNNFVHWLHEEAGVLFWKAYQEYTQRHFFGKPKHWPHHPFLFIRIDAQGYGMPLTLAAMEKIFDKAASRVGVHGFSPHSLRHFYGYYFASVLKRPIEEAQACMHHASIVSTQVYYRTAPEAVRQEILVAAYQTTGRPIPDELMARNAVALTIPRTWAADSEDLALLRFARGNIAK